ncbi:related to putative protein [Cephalotrichum gorgonifer]|uniref:Uncharacterized protein n=1 Tax=Cephalotrichum gorgonifer TaxID=2041049 RepID=A0AAE8N3D9_9PEZI|nr:related to putative protein [Cephalotrichum gorgonifer]
MRQFISAWALVLVLSHFQLARAVAKYSDDVCCERAQAASQFVGDIPETIICGQAYNASIDPAPNLYVSYKFCASECSGFGLSEGRKPDQWAAPIVQFLLPSVIFSMSIPRRLIFCSTDFLQDTVPRPNNVVARKIVSLLLILISLMFVVIDTIIWVILIMGTAGIMMVAGLHEALLDYKILKALARGRTGPQQLRATVELLVTVVSGNLRLNGNGGRSPKPNEAITDALMADANVRVETDDDGRNFIPFDRSESSGPLMEASQQLPNMISERLKRLMSAQSAFGAIVGAPVVFYLGAFVYTILELMNKPSNQDAAISLAFGVEWMIIVHVAIVSGCLLASNNPSPAAMLARPPLFQGPQPWWRRIFPPVHDGEFQPVFMWRRGINKQEWLRESEVWSNTGFREDARIKWWEHGVYVVFPTLILISLPPAAGAFVALKTPPEGWGCRSLSFVVYAAFQVILVPIYYVAQVKRPATPTGRMSWLVHSTIGWFFMAVFYLVVGLSIFTSVGTTLMQIIGVYRNCFCYVNANMWLTLDEATVNVASDTELQRQSSRNWIIMGGVATGFMGLCSFWGWQIQMSMRRRYGDIIRRYIQSRSQIQG